MKQNETSLNCSFFTVLIEDSSNFVIVAWKKDEKRAQSHHKSKTIQLDESEDNLVGKKSRYYNKFKFPFIQCLAVSREEPDCVMHMSEVNNWKNNKE